MTTQDTYYTEQNPLDATLTSMLSSAFKTTRTSNISRIISLLSDEHAFISKIGEEIKLTKYPVESYGLSLDLVGTLLDVERQPYDNDTLLKRRIVLDMLRRRSNGTMDEMIAIVNKYTNQELEQPDDLPTDDFSYIYGWGTLSWDLELMNTTPAIYEEPPGYFRFLEQPALGQSFPKAAFRLIFDSDINTATNLTGLTEVINVTKPIGVYFDPTIEFIMNIPVTESRGTTDTLWDHEGERTVSGGFSVTSYEGGELTYGFRPWDMGYFEEGLWNATTTQCIIEPPTAIVYAGNVTEYTLLDEYQLTTYPDHDATDIDVFNETEELIYYDPITNRGYTNIIEPDELLQLIPAVINTYIDDPSKYHEEWGEQSWGQGNYDQGCSSWTLFY